jgi:RNA polymerase sigma-70 factor (ECF subfamily)
LILRLPDARDVDAWDEVVAVYGPLVYRLARRKGLQPADADDLVQEVLAAVSRSVEQWLAKPDRGRFRLWLFRIARNTAINFLTRPKHRPLGSGGGEAADWLAGHAAPDVPDEFDAEYRRETFRWASRQVRGAVTEKTWQAFWQTTVENRPIEQVAEELGMTAGNIYVARSRVMARLRELVRELEEHEA